MWGVCWKSRLRVVPKFPQRETRGRVKITPREKGETRRDFHARTRFVFSTSREEKRAYSWSMEKQYRVSQLFHIIVNLSRVVFPC